MPFANRRDCAGTSWLTRMAMRQTRAGGEKNIFYIYTFLLQIHNDNSINIVKHLFAILLLIYSNACFSQKASELKKQAEELLKQQEYSLALEKISRAILDDSTNFENYIVKAECHLKLSDHQEAYNIYSKAISLNPSQGILYNNRGNLLTTIRYYDEAIADYTIAIELATVDSQKRLELTNRAAAKIMKRDFSGAYDDLITAYKFDSTDIAVLNNLGAVCDDIGRGNETLKYLQKILQQDPNNVGAYANIGFKYQEMGDYKKAIDYYNKLLTIEPNEPLGYSNRSFNKLKLNDLQGALKDINRSLELYPGNAYAYKVRALIYIQNNQFSKACVDIQTALDQDYITTYGNDIIEIQKQHCSKK